MKAGGSQFRSVSRSPGPSISRQYTSRYGSALPKYENLMDRFDAMSVLLAVVDAGSLSAGARRLGMPLATVSRRMTDLESHPRARLFDRGSRRLELTDAGRSYVAACRRILDDVGAAER